MPVKISINREEEGRVDDRVGFAVDGVEFMLGGAEVFEYLSGCHLPLVFWDLAIIGEILDVGEMTVHWVHYEEDIRLI